MVDYDITAEALLRLTRWWSMNDVWDCGMAYTIGPTFEEAYEIRAAIIADRVLHLGRVRSVAHAFCDRALLTQGVVEEKMYYMGYGANRNEEGIPNCSCVADACTSASTILETVKAYPESSRVPDYILSVCRFADYVMDKYADENGVMGVGILGHKINPWRQYWCACALLVQVMADLYGLTGEQKYLNSAVFQLEYLSVYDYKASPCSNWNLAPTEVVMYAGEGIVAGLRSKEVCKSLASRPSLTPEKSTNNNLDKEPIAALNRVKDAGATSIDECSDGTETALDSLLARWNEFTEWLYRNQEIDGIWQESKDYRCYQLGLSWLLASAVETMVRTPKIETMIDRQMGCIVGIEGIVYHGLFCRPFATALAHLSAAATAELCKSDDNDVFQAALAKAAKRLPVAGW